MSETETEAERKTVKHREIEGGGHRERQGDGEVLKEHLDKSSYL